MIKTCRFCNKTKDISEFNKSKSHLDGYEWKCRACKKIHKDTWSKTKIGVIKTIYSSQLDSSKRRNHPNPSYTQQEFIEWMQGQKLFDYYYDNWVNSGYKKAYKPSVDRLDDFKPYSFDNIQLTIVLGNQAHAIQDKQAGIGTQGKQTYKVRAINLKTGEMEIFPSSSYAVKALALRGIPVNRQNIQKVCHGQRPQCGGFHWEYV